MSGEQKRQFVEVAPDGPQGGKLKLGVSDDKQLQELREKVQTNGRGLNIDNVRQTASELNIPVVDD